MDVKKKLAIAAVVTSSLSFGTAGSLRDAVKPESHLTSEDIRFGASTLSPATQRWIEGKLKRVPARDAIADNEYSGPGHRRDQTPPSPDTPASALERLIKRLLNA